MKKPTKTAEELKAMIRQKSGADITVRIDGDPDGSWIFATAHWGAETAFIRRAHEAGHALRKEYDIRQD